MTDTARPAPAFLADDRALDLLNSIAAPSGTEIEWLGNGRDLLAWLEAAGLVPGDVAMRFRAETSAGALDDIAARARALREWFREFVAAHAGRRVGPSALASLDRINRLLARDQGFRQIEMRDRTGWEPGDPSMRWQRHRRWRTAGDLLLPIAEAMGDLVCQVNFERVKNCEGPTCTMWFHDVSKNHTRRWCSMAVCGNRAKATAHRARKRAGRQGQGIGRISSPGGP